MEYENSSPHNPGPSSPVLWKPDIVGLFQWLKGSFELENRMPVLWEIFLRQRNDIQNTFDLLPAQVSLTAVERGAKRDE